MSSTKFLTGKVALVTGSSRGIGAKNGADVVINYVRSKGPAEAVAEKARAYGVQAECIQADVTKPEEIERLFTVAVEKMGRLDVVFSNAGVESWARPDQYTKDEMDNASERSLHTTRAKVNGQLFVAQQAYKHLRDEGRLILMSSVPAQKGIPAHAIYAASKAAIQGAVRCLAWDFGPRKITVNCVASGGVKTAMYSGRQVYSGRENMSEAEIDGTLGKWSPFNRPGYPNDIVGAILMLASPHSQWITGQTLHVSGGAHMAA
ncbi:hypothetical protein BD626DRAFT_548069 [Schizophyllum amplum]|uniref:Uncharacterized protein n=1 Tax=Schizophyllum amplum TaxID=97359 RepID=A0A550CG32_9AGAR|nr:hypothetical protein BD626DRAFT_548069 [Auriculariopsis ampla]